jgi:histidinol-phosphate aminotransferase
VYPINAAKMGAVTVRAPLAGSSYDLEALADCVSERTKIVYVTNPNNPTGGLVARAELERFLDGLPGHVLPVLDEAYFEYVEDPEYPDGAREHLARGRRCVVLRTFSKIYGLAGFRVGYGLCPPDVAAACLKVKNAFDVTQSALDAALASLGAADELARRREETRAGRERLAAGLRERGFEPLTGVANFLCIDVGDGSAFASRLERQGVIVRPLGPFGDPASVRISVGSEEELDRLFAAIDAG